MKHSAFRRTLFLLFFLLVQAPLAAVAGMNLRVDSVAVLTPSANAGGQAQLAVTVSNVGDVFTYAIVHTFLSADAAITEGDDTRLWMAQGPVQPGESITITQTVTLPSNLATGNYFLGGYAQGWYEDVDPNDNAGSGDIFVSGATCAADTFEQDDTRQSAGAIPLNETQERNHCDDPDDWVAFPAVAGVRYGIQASGRSSMHDIMLAVFAADGTPLAATTDITENPKLIWTAPASGTYYVRSRAHGLFYNTGLNTNYTLVIADVLADIIVPYSSSTWVQGTAGGTGSFYTSVSNIGFVDTGAFDIGVYISPDPIVTRDDRRIGHRRVGGLAPDGSYDIGYVFLAFPADLPAGDYYMGAIADDRDEVAEYEEDNHHSQVVPARISGPSCTPDMYESDDLIETAQPIVLGEQQVHNFCEDGYDWLFFDAEGGRTYYLRAKYLGYPQNQTVYAGRIEVYDTNGQKLQEANGLLAWTPAQSGRYYMLIRGGLSSLDYTFAVLDQAPDLVALSWTGAPLGVPRGGVVSDGTYTVRNFGFVDAPAHDLGFYLSADSVITPTDQLLRTVVVPVLAPDAETTERFIRVPIPASQPLGDYQFGIFADPGNSVVEFDETNNGKALQEMTVVDPICAPDAHDDDDLPGQAKPLALNEVQNRNFCEDAYDWVTVDLQAGQTYAFETKGVAGGDPRPIVYDTEGRSVLAGAETAFDNGAYGWSSFTASSTGRYYVLATSTDDPASHARYGEHSSYTLRVTSCQPDAFEQDGTDRTQGQPIAIGASQARNHCEDGTDWAVLTLGAAGSYTIATSALGANADTVVEIHTAASTSALASNDNTSVNNEASSVTYNFTSAGTYYIKVRGKQRGAGTEYTLSVRAAKGKKQF